MFYFDDFRYGRDDEELLGLRFCNEVVVAADQIYPPPSDQEIELSSNTSSNKDSSKYKGIAKTDGKKDSSSTDVHKIESSVKPTNQKVHPTVGVSYLNG